MKPLLKNYSPLNKLAAKFLIEHLSKPLQKLGTTPKIISPSTIAERAFLNAFCEEGKTKSAFWPIVGAALARAAIPALIGTGGEELINRYTGGPKRNALEFAKDTGINTLMWTLPGLVKPGLGTAATALTARGYNTLAEHALTGIKGVDRLSQISQTHPLTTGAAALGASLAFPPLAPAFTAAGLSPASNATWLAANAGIGTLLRPDKPTPPQQMQQPQQRSNQNMLNQQNELEPEESYQHIRRTNPYSLNL